MRRPALLVGVALIAVAMCAALFAGPASSQRPKKCVQPASGPFAPVKGAPVKLDPKSETLTIPFGNGRDEQSDIATLDASGPLPYRGRGIRAITRGNFVRGDGRQIPDDQISLQVNPKPRGGFVEVKLCVNPKDVKPGRYKGAVIVVGRGIEPEAVPVEVTLRYDNLPVVLFVAFLGAGLGFLARAVADLEKIAQPPDAENRTGRAVVTRATVGSYAVGLRFWFSVALGVGIAFYAFWQIYDKNPAFGGDTLEDLIQLFAVAFGGVAGGMTATDVLSAFPKINLKKPPAGA